MINLDNFRICLLCSDTGKRARELLLFCSVARLYLTPCNPMDCSTPSSSVHYFWVHSNSCHLSLWCHPTISSSVTPFFFLPSVFPSIRVFSNVLALHIRWPKYWSFSFSFSISPSNEYSGLISCRIDGFDLFAVQGTFKSLLQHHSLKTSILWCSAFFMVWLSHLYMTIGTTIALTIWTFVHKMMSLPFNMLSWFVIRFLLRSKHDSRYYYPNDITMMLEQVSEFPSTLDLYFFFFPSFRHLVRWCENSSTWAMSSDLFHFCFGCAAQHMGSQIPDQG